MIHIKYFTNIFHLISLCILNHNVHKFFSSKDHSSSPRHYRLYYETCTHTYILAVLSWALDERLSG